ncbi:nuclear transport factor 2 family protein [Synechococcales cyanobacterium C]|uniref:Nuclear transport factor 2 family protein n=1 Tax=Petrachloros mirabilis ULC683 TaxID=2781853 RepID=A0A8K1ZZ34_9CYAN|nr:nuclear transport factor 2 family protein [Petrachloros mirabilis]NCJ06777.1 nuclear transport factor 2 family protein [Petrachloros mirabilis ULC683]
MVNQSFPRGVALSQRLRFSMMGLILLCIPLGLGDPGKALTIAEAQLPSTSAQPATSAPADLSDRLAEIDAAANRQDLNALMRFYSSDFQHQDGLNHAAMTEVIKNFWDTHEQVEYTTKLLSWQSTGTNRYTAETETTVTGTQILSDRELKLTATLRSQQQFVEGQIVRQTTLAEQSQITSGESPPTVTVNMPAQVQAGQSFNFDAIVQEPLGSQILMGAVYQEPVNAENYQKKPDIQLEPLRSGGFFKTGRAAAEPSQEWISAVFVREGGMTFVTQRLNVISAQASTPATAR